MLAAIADQSATVGQPLAVAVSASDADGPSPLTLTATGVPGWATFGDAGGAVGRLSGTPDDVAGSPYSVTVIATDGGGLTASRTFALTVVAASSGGQLTSTLTTPAVGSTVNLTDEGVTDWVHWGLTGATSVNRKGGVAAQIGALTAVNGGVFAQGTGFSAVRYTYAWSDGSPSSSASTKNFVKVSGVGKGFEVTAPADGNDRTLVVYLNGWSSQGRVEVSLSDGSAPAFSTTAGDLGAGYERRLAVSYRAASAGQTLTVRWLQEAGTGEVSIGAATLQGAAAPGISPPFEDDFSDGNVNGWQFFDQTEVESNWGFTQGALEQDARVIGSTSYALSSTYRQGTFAFLGSGFGFTDYRLSADVESLNLGLAEDIGVIFRYRDTRNFYRLSVSSRFGFTRLEKRVDGVYSPLATDSRGYLRGEIVHLEVEVRGTQILVWRNGEPLFAAVDGSHSRGTIGFYTQDKARVDNVRVDLPSDAPIVVLMSPLSYLTSSGSSIRASAVALNAPSGSAVEFSLDTSSPSVDPAPPYEVEFSSLAPGNYEVTAVLRDAYGTELARDTNRVVGVGGEYLVGVGDSITNGIGDFYAGDNTSALGRVLGFQGYQAILTDLLDETGPEPTNLVFNEGIGGDTSYNAAFSRVDSIKARHPDMNTALAMLGTNDSNQLIPSGLGCSGTSCNGTFKQNMQELVDKLVASGVAPVVALPPPAWTSSMPWTSSTNNRIREYISVIENELTGVVLGPDFFSFFMPSATENYRSLFSDTLHPNGLGYRVMSFLWHNALSEPSAHRPLPYILRDLSLSSSALPQQNLLEAGNVYYVDEGFTLSTVPSELAEGRWIMTANADRNSTDSDYVSFRVDRDVGDPGLYVYVAYDADATTLPGWLSSGSGFVDTGDTITTTNQAASTMRLYRKSFLNSTESAIYVTLGGNSGQLTGAEANYVLVVVEQQL